MLKNFIFFFIFFSFTLNLNSQNLSKTDENIKSNSRHSKSKKSDNEVLEPPSKSVEGITFMLQNLNTSNFKDGSFIPEAKNAEEWVNYIQKKEPAWCYYQYSKKNEKKLGKIYNYYALISEKGLAPEGWHIPNVFELYKIFFNEKAAYRTSTYSNLRIDKQIIAENIYREKSTYLFNDFNCFPYIFSVYPDDLISKFAASACPSDGVFNNQFKANLNSIFTVSDWYGSWWTSSQINENNKLSNLFLEAVYKPEYIYNNGGDVLVNNPFNVSFKASDVNIGRPIICIKDYPNNIEQINPNEIVVSNSKIFNEFKIIDSVKVGDPKINLIKEYTLYYYKGVAQTDLKTYGNQTNRKPAIYDNNIIQPDSSKNIKLYDTTYNLSYVYSYKNELYSEIFKFKNTEIRLFVNWGEVNNYRDTEFQEFILNSIKTNQQLAAFGDLKNKISNSSFLTERLNEIKFSLDVSPFSSVEGLNLKIGDLTLKISNEKELFNLFLDKSISNKIINNGEKTIDFAITNNEAKVFKGEYKKIIPIDKSCNLNQKRKDDLNLFYKLPIKIDLLVKSIHKPFIKELNNLIENNQVSQATTFYSKIKNNLPSIKGVDNKILFDEYLSNSIVESKLNMEQIINSLYPLLIVDSLKKQYINIIGKSYKYRYITNTDKNIYIKFTTDYKSFQRRTKDICKGLSIFYGQNDAIYDFLLRDNDLTSFDCQILNSLLEYHSQYPKGHGGKNYLGILSITIDKGIIRYLPEQMYFPARCGGYMYETIHESLAYIKRAETLRPNSPECLLYKALYTESNTIQRYLDQCTVTEICSQCDLISSALKNKSSMPYDYYLALKENYLSSCVTCSLCNYNVCGGKGKVRKADGTIDRRYK
jgi:uncharacterized protein (TIGR02145 family)